MIAANDTIPNFVVIPTSAGDLIDRVTILQLKAHRIKNENQLKHIFTELHLLMSPYHQLKKFLKDYSEIEKLKNALFEINAQLWDHEDQIRQQVADSDIANTSKSIIHANNLRSSIKYQINFLLNSSIIEEKSYSYQQQTNTTS